MVTVGEVMVIGSINRPSCASVVTVVAILIGIFALRLNVTPALVVTLVPTVILHSGGAILFPVAEVVVAMAMDIASAIEPVIAELVTVVVVALLLLPCLWTVAADVTDIVLPGIVLSPGLCAVAETVNVAAPDMVTADTFACFIAELVIVVVLAMVPTFAPTNT